jgi:uncharacterized protein YegL
LSSGTAHNDDNALLTLAFYFAVDVSYSMVASGALDRANQILPTVLDGITSSNMLSDVVRVGMIDFSDDAQVVLRLDDARNVKTIPHCQARGGTSYAAAFRLLRKEIESDMRQLKDDGYKVYRPVVFFITDGAPTDTPAELHSAFADLTDPNFRHRPNIIPFGVDGATKETVDPWVYPPAGSKKPMRSYVTASDVDPAAAVTQLAEVLLGSIVASAGSVTAEGMGGGFVPPDDDDLGSEWQ